MQNILNKNTGPLLLLAASIGLTACGGGGGSAAPAPAPAPAPSPPASAPAPEPTPAPTPAPSPAPTPAPAPGAAPQIASCDVFPATAVFNTRIDDAQRFPVHASSATWIASIGGTRAFHPDWGTNDNPQQPADYYGIPYNVVDGTIATTYWPLVSFNPTDPRAGSGDSAPDESDCAVPAGDDNYALVRNCTTFSEPYRRFPFPRDNLIKAEAGACNDARQCGDRHVLIVEQGICRLWESYASYQLNGQWYSYSTAAWNLKSNDMRPDTWTSGDAAGLPMLPLLARAAEASAGDIRHALRVTLRDSVLARSHVWPARHHAGGDTAGGVPFGAVLRLKASFVPPASWSAQAKALAVAMQRYGLYVADIGSDLYVQGEPSAQWQDATISNLKTLHASDFEFVDMGVITRDSRFSPNSFQGSW